MQKLTIAALALGLCFSPALAQTTTPKGAKPAGTETSRADCLKNFQTADKNRDGSLSVTEAENAKQVVPTGLAMQGPITQAEFMSACTAVVPKGG
jgi:hypothetical protein